MQRSAAGVGVRLLAGLVPVVLLALALLPLGDLLVTTLRSRGAGLQRPEHVQALVVLGSRLDGGQMTPLLVHRVERTAALYREALRAGGHPWVVASGGPTGDPADGVTTSTPSEATVVAAALVARGVPRAAVLREDRALTTAENLADSSALLAAQGTAVHRVVVITSDTHVARTRALLREEGTGPAAFGGARVQVVGTPSPADELAQGLPREARMALGSRGWTLAVSAASAVLLAQLGRRRRGTPLGALAPAPALPVA